jgi:parallel beta-helix repeat protein
MKKAALTVILICLMTSGAVCIRPIKAQSQSNITINADGTVAPSTAPIRQAGDTYTLTGDVVGSITVMRSNATFDGNGHSLTGLGMGHGVEGLSIGCNYYSSPPVLAGASNVTVKNLAVKGSVFGISLSNTTDSLVYNNTISETGNGILSMDEQTAGIYVYHGSSNVIKGNNISNNYNGMLFLESDNNLIVGNTITNCSNPYGLSAFGILFWGASNNTIYHNSFLNNTAQAYSGITIFAAGELPLAKNIWDDGFPNGGNYWSDYVARYPNATEVDNSGVGDTPYVIDAKNTDRYPLMEPYNVASPRISVMSPVNQIFNESSVPLSFTVNKQAVWMGYSLDGQDNVTVTGNVTLSGLSSGLHNVTVYAEDSFGNIGVSETISFSVEIPFPLTIAATASCASATIIVIGLLVYFKKHKR